MMRHCPKCGEETPHVARQDGVNYARAKCLKCGYHREIFQVRDKRRVREIG